MSTVRPTRKRSKAWLYYSVLAVLSLFAIPSTHGASLLFTAAAGAYAAYLYRGGRIVFWIW